ncbi:OmpA family protein [Xylanibacter muris]|uniref:OmpA family protein n=1 Tax=Xylanibacter muris TaxID=2736290 RepID=A0ABX2AQY8_9BACT|nr:OmpA family protein [Xylanibacter muris]NPD92366.1 OmpA family protein [Xylanibacter muris]
MKKLFMMLAVAALSAETANAQSIKESKLTDNWYVGVNGGANVKTTHTSLFRNINPSAGLRIGRNITPVFGFAFEGEVYFDNKGSNMRPLGTFVKGLNTSVLGTTNFTNLFGGYNGQPRVFELIGVYGLGWGHVFSNSGANVDTRNIATSKLGLDFAFNLGAKRAWQLYVEPNITYGLGPHGDEIKMNSNNSALGVLVGVNYKFGNSNGTHNFQNAVERDQYEIDALNDRINELRVLNTEKDNALSGNAEEIARLEKQLAEAKKYKPAPVIVNKEHNILQPTVIFRQGKSVIDAAQYASISMIAQYMKKHKDHKILVKGYASPEGSYEINEKLSKARAEAVKKALVTRYKISSDRITAEGMGATDKLFEEVDFNRVVTFIDITK